MDNLYIEAGDTVTPLKVHRLAWNYRCIPFASLVGAANAVKALRASIYQGCKLRYGHETWKVPKSDTSTCMWQFRQAGLGSGYAHATLRMRPDNGIVLLENSDAEWMQELMRISTVPIQPEFLPYLRRRIVEDGRTLRLDLVNCEVQVYGVGDERLGQFLVDGVQVGELEVPECEMDLGGLEGLPAYIHAYAQRMVESAGSSLRPLFHPERDRAELPPLGRSPFVPQGWLIEGARRALV